MAVNLELLNTTLADLRGPLEMSFAQDIRLMKEAERKSNISTEKGTYIERPIMGGSPSRATGVFVGDETLDTTRRKKINKYQVEPHRVVMAIAIPKRDMIMNSGKTGAIKMIKEYPKAAQEAFNIDLERYLLTGTVGTTGLAVDADQLYGWSTFNGQFAAGVNTGTTNGLLDMVAVASQSDTVQNVAKSQSIYHYNQYADITSFASNGDEKLRAAYRAAAHFAKDPNGGPDFIVADDATFGRYTLSKKDIVRLQIVGGKTDDGNLLVDNLGLGRMVASQHIVLTDFTGDAADGVCYGINTDFWEWVWYQKPTMSDFEDRIANQDSVIAKLEMMGGHVLTKFPAHFVVTGGGTA
jgi:hypothetical protein